ncbi:MAG: sodium:calcium antiporter [Elusimicrobia bacterium CG1_02_56_21]|nr:MAG: sodium:calcium antiporter [Elusimicrobia bacterium CG1_02_56_21]
MEAALNNFVHGLPWLLLLSMIVAMLLALGKGADLLVQEAVTLSVLWGVPTAVIGATIVSLGTTTPEAAVSVLAALRGSHGLALGNAVGSIICDTGLILGIATLIAPLKLDPRLVNRQGWIQLGAGLLLIACCIPYAAPGAMFSAGGRLPQAAGLFFLVLLAGYLYLSIRWAKCAPCEVVEEEKGVSNLLILLKLLGAIAVVVGSSWLLIPAVQEAAIRLHVPEAIIAATLVAFGTSLPELVTAVTAARKGHGELAVGNIVGADILNVLFVSGAAAAVTRGGLLAPPQFFKILFPAMLLVLLVFRAGIRFSGGTMKRPFGFVLLGTYIAATCLGYLI